MKKKILTLSIAAATALNTLSFAAPLDLTNKVNSNKNYSFNEFIKNGENFNYVAGNMTQYVIEAANGNFYNAKEVSDAIDAGAADFVDAIKNLEPVEKPVVGGLKVESVSAITNTKLVVSLSTAVDSAEADNFKIPGATVISATLDDSKKVVTLRVTGLEAKKDYVVTATGLKIKADVKADSSYNYQMPDVNALYNPKLTFANDGKDLKADGASKVLVTFTLADAEGTVVEEAEDVEVRFSTTFGNLAQARVSVQKGIATVMLNSEFLTEIRIAEIKAQIIEAEDKSLIGLNASASIAMNPNPDSGELESVGASMTDAESNQADRVIVYFNREVDVNDYLVKTGANKGKIDATKAVVTVREQATSATNGSNVAVRGLLPVAGNKKALQVLTDVELNASNALTDNHNVYVSFEDKTKTVPVKRDKTFKLTDARVPSMLNVSTEGLRKLTIIFSEAVDKTTAENLANWNIDGMSLDTNAKWGTSTGTGAKATVEVGEFKVSEGTDKRHVVTVTLGKDATGKQIFFPEGDHSITASKVGDWAILTDSSNILNTQTYDFNIQADNTIPTASVDVQSPEQYVVSFDKDILENATTLAAALKMEKYDNTTSTWIPYATTFGTATTPADTTLEFKVTNISAAGSNNKFLVEADYDWTKVYNTSSSTKNYFNDKYRIKLDKDSVTAGVNGKKNVDNLLVLNGPMATPDTESPKIQTMKLSTAGNSYDVTLNEPVKLMLDGAGLVNTEGETLAQGQTSLTYTTAEFIKTDNSETITGTIATSFVDNEDKVINVTPSKKLSPGKWELVVRSISDDVGNTAASAKEIFTVEGEQASDDFRILWAAAVENNDYSELTNPTPNLGTGDYIFIKFNKAISVTGDFKNVLQNTNYTFNGGPLPSTADIQGNIKGYDDLDQVTDSITIFLPENSLQASNVINISELLESLTSGTTVGTQLVNGGEYVLPINRRVAQGADVDTLAELEAALADQTISNIVLGGNITGDIAVNRPVDIDLNGFTITGDVTYNTPIGSLIQLTATTAGTITGDLTVNTPNSDFTVGAGVTVSGTTTITDVLSSTFRNAGNLANVTITDSNGSGFVNTGIVSGTVTVDTTGEVTLGGTINNVEVTKAAKITVAPTAAITTLTSRATGVQLTGAGTVATKQVDGGTIVDADGQEVAADATGDQAAAEDLAAAKKSLKSAIEAAKSAVEVPTVATAEGEVAVGTKWITQEDKTTYSEAIANAVQRWEAAGAVSEVELAITNLQKATTAFETAQGTGTKEEEVVVEATGVAVTSDVVEGTDVVDAVVEAATAATVEFTVEGTVSTAGGIKVTVGEVEVDVALEEEDDAAAVAGKIAEATFEGYTVAAEGAVVTFTATVAGETTTTAGSVDVQSTGLTEISEVTVTEGTDSSETSAQKAATQAVVKFTVTSGATNAGTLVVKIGEATAEVTVSADADINAVATAIREASITGFKASGADAEVIFTKDDAGKTTSTAASVADKE